MATISQNRLPSRSLGCSVIGSINLEPMTYNELLNYVSGVEYKSGSIGQLLWDIQYILKPSFKDYRKLSSFDLNFLISLRKLNSVLDEGNFTYKNEKHSLNELSFTEIDEDTMKLCKVLDHDFMIKSVGEVEDAFENLTDEELNHKAELGILAVDMGIPLKDLIEMPASKATTITYMMTKVMSQPKLGGEDIILFGKSSDLFQAIIQGHGYDKLEIGYSEVTSD